MGDPVKIIVTAETAEAAANLKAFVAAQGGGLNLLGKNAADAGKGIDELAGKVYYLRSSIDAIRFAAMDGGARAAFYAVDELTRGLAAAGIGLSTLLPLFAGVAVAGGAGYLVWLEYMSGVEDTTKQIKELLAALDKVPALLEKINGLQKAGLISPAAASEFKDYLGQNPKKKLYVAPDGTVSPNPTPIDERAEQLPGIPIEGARAILEKHPQPTANPAQANNYVSQQIPPVSDEQIKAANADKEILQRAREDALEGIARERQALDDKYADEKQKIQDNSVIELETENQKNEKLKQLDADYYAAKKNLDDKQSAEGMKKDEEWAKAYSEAQAESLRMNQENVAEEKRAADELARQLQLKQEIARLDAQIKLKQIELNPFLNDTTKAQQSVPAIQDLIGQNNTSIGLLQNTAGTTKDDSARLEALKQINDLTLQQVELQHQLQEAQNVSNYSFQLGKEITQLQNVGTVAQQTAQSFGQVWRTMTDSISSNLAQVLQKHQSWGEAARAIYKSVVDDFISQVSHMVVQWVLQHTLMAAISAAWHALETGQQAAATGAQVAIHSAGETAKTGATAAGSTSRGGIYIAETILHGVMVAARVAAHIAGEILSTAVTLAQGALRAAAYIVEAAIGAMVAMASVPYVGPILAIVAAGAMIAEGAHLMGAFAEGGRPPVGEASIVGEKGWEIFVPDRHGTILSHDQSLQMMSNGGRDSSSAAGGGASSKTEVHNFIYHDQTKLMNDLAKSDAFEKNVVDVMSRTIHKFR